MFEYIKYRVYSICGSQSEKKKEKRKNIRDSLFDMSKQ